MKRWKAVSVGGVKGQWMQIRLARRHGIRGIRRVLFRAELHGDWVIHHEGVSYYIDHVPTGRWAARCSSLSLAQRGIGMILRANLPRFRTIPESRRCGMQRLIANVLKSAGIDISMGAQDGASNSD